MNILQNPTHTTKRGKTSFDVSKTLKFTSPCGLLSPVYYDFLIPGDKVKFSTEMFSRTQPLVKPAMLQVRQEVEWFFVPMNQLFQFFEDLQYSIKDMKTDFVNNFTQVAYMPNFDVKDYVNLYASKAYMDKTTDEVPSQERDLFGIPKCFNADRLAQLLGFGGWSCLRDSPVGDSDTKLAVVNAFLLGAYHKIYYDVYRLTDREANDPSYYNFDSAYATPLDGVRIDQLFTMHYRAWDKDYFTNNVPSPNFLGKGQVNPLNGLTGKDFFTDPADVVGNYNFLADFNTMNSPVDHLQNYNPQVSPLGNDQVIPNLSSLANDQNYIDGTVTVERLNYLYAFAKQQEITRRAAKHYDAQTLAHYGVKVPTGISGEVYRLGGDQSNIQISDVVSTAETSEGALGQQAGTGISYNKNDVKEFSAPCHGILMAIHSVIPEADYASIGLDKFNTKRIPSDYYTPELDNVGMQPLFEYESIFGDFQGSNPQALVGFQYRYSEYKLKHNTAALGFLDTNVSHFTAFRDFQVYEEDQSLTARPALYNYLIDPDYLGNCFEVSYRFNSSHENVASRATAYARDPFIHMFRFHVYKSSIMSTYGLPTFIH